MPSRCGETDVEHDKRIVLGRQCRVGLVAAIGAVDDVVVPPQQARDPCRQFAIVLGKQYSHFGRSTIAARELLQST